MNVWVRVRSHFTDVVTLARPATMSSDGFDETKGDAKCVFVFYFSKNTYSTIQHASLVVFTASAEETEFQLSTALRSWQHCGIAELFVFLHPFSDVTKALNEIVFKHKLLGNRAESGTLPRMSQICFLFTS